MINTKEMPALKKAMGSSWYPAVIQWPTLLIFVLIIHSLLLGGAAAEQSFGIALTWLLWWPALGLTFLLAGRFWCAVCPFSFISDFVQKAVGNNLPAPRLLKRHGFYIIIALFLLLTWCEEILHIVHSTLATGALLLLIITGVVASGAFFERRTWCRYLCPLGGMAAIFSRAGLFQLRGSREKCVRCNSVECYKGGAKAAGCAMFEFPRILESNANCTLCGACVKNCPNDSLVVSLRAPSSELWSPGKLRLDESLFAALMAGVLSMLNTLEMAGSWLPARLGQGNEALGFTLFFVAAVSLPVLATLAAAKAASLGDHLPTRTNFALFGYGLIPVVLAAHIGHTGKEFLEKGLRIPGSLGLWPGQADSAALLGSEGILIIHLLVLAAGVLASLYTAWRISGERVGPQRRLGFLIAFGFLAMTFAGLNAALVLAAD